MLLNLFAGGRTMLPLACVVGLAFATQSLFALENAHTVSPAVQRASDLGAVEPAQDITLTVYLNLRNQAAFDEAVEKLYDPESPTYHHWMTDQDLQKFAPAASDLKTVRQELEKNGLSVMSTDPRGFSIRVHGPAANVEKAFQTQLHTLSLKGKTFRAHVADAKLTGSAGSLVASVVGLDEHSAKPMLKHPINPRTGLKRPPIPLSKVQASGGFGAFITNQCMYPAQEFTYTTPGASLPIGVYFGNVYNPGVSPSGDFLSCGFTPAQLQAHYGLTAAYKAGLNGAGQTIVLLEAYGYPTAQADANIFSKLAGLPVLNSSNFQVVYPEGVPPNQAAVAFLTGWDGEIALDIQWAHSMAPWAKIMVVASNGQDNEDQQASMNYIIAHKLGTVVSDSWGNDVDLVAGPLEQNSFNSILKMAAAQGISFQFSSGDNGDEGLGSPLGAPDLPSNSPYATAVGGTTILNNPNGAGSLEIGWGDAFTAIASNGVLDPPVPFEFFGGSGGGESVFFPKPSWQSKLPGTGRQVPDISALGDPQTGVPVILTQQGMTYLDVIGGTSLSSPIVTAILAIATQKAGHALGLAAPLIASLPAGAVTDILPLTSPTNLAGTVFDQQFGATFYSPSFLFQGLLETNQPFISANWPFDALDADAVAFAMDSSLTVTKGWDNVTGFGVPNGLTFIDAIAKK
jgi:subtilase family serine protease